MKHIDKLHNCKNRLDFLTKYRAYEEKWKKWKLSGFCKYFRKQWVKSRFSNCPGKILNRDLLEQSLRSNLTIISLKSPHRKCEILMSNLIRESSEVSPRDI